VSPIKGPTPGIVCSSWALGSERAIGASSWSIGAILRSSSSISARCSATESRHTAGMPRCSSSSRAPGLSQAGKRDSQAELREQPEDPVARRGAQLDQVGSPAKPLADRAVLLGGDPDRRDQVSATELGQHPGVDLVGLAGKRGDVSDLARVGDFDRPACALELVLDPDRAAHHLDAGPDLGTQLQGEPRESVLVCGDQALAVDRPGLRTRAPRGAAIGPIDSDIVHAGSPSAPNSSCQPPF
jgi:hypothetical protein